MKTFSVTMMAVCVMGFATGQAAGQLPFSEDFEGLSTGPLNGQGGWVADGSLRLDNDAGNPSSQRGYDDSIGASSQGVVGNFMGTHSLGTTVTDGILTATALVQASVGSNQKGGSLFLSDGGSNVLEVEALGGSATSTFNVKGPGDDVNTPAPFPAGLEHFGDGTAITNFNDSGWVQVEVEYNLNDGTAVGRLRDVLEFGNSAFPLPLSADILEVTFPAFTAFDVTTVGIRSNTPFAGNPGRVDIIEVSYIPEPASAVLLGLGGLLMFRRRSA